MSDDLESDKGVRLGVAAALSRQYAEDLRSFVPYLADTLERALPGQVEVIQRGLFKKETVGVSVTFGSDRYRFEHVGHSLTASRTHVVRGIALKTDELSIEDALAGLAAALEDQAKTNAHAHSALTSLLGL